MTQLDSESRLRIIKKRIVNEVQAYHLKFSDGMPMNVLSAKYGRALQYIGGFPEVIEQMSSSGELLVNFEKGGARKVFPAGPSVVQEDSASHWF